MAQVFFQRREDNGDIILPKELFEPEWIDKLNDKSKILYGMMLSRSKQSDRRDWIDSNGNPYIIYTREEMMKDLHYARATISACLKQLTDAGLIEIVRQGGGAPNIIYVGHFR